MNRGWNAGGGLRLPGKVSHNAYVMFGFNWIDLVTVILLAWAVYAGIKAGLLTQLLAIAGCFGTLFVAGWLFPHLLPFHNQALRTSLNTTLVLVASVAAGLVCLHYGNRIHWSPRMNKLRQNRNFKVGEDILAGAAALAASLVLVWLMGTAISRLPFEGFSNSVSDSFIVQQLTRHMPPVPAVLSVFGHQIDPNSQPYVAIQPKPQADFNYSPAAEQAAAAKGAASVVRITSFGCGGLVTGSGFAAGPSLVATNAHVIAGVKRPIIKYNGHSYEGVPVLFDAALDIAILRVEGLDAPALPLAPANAPLDSTVAVLGYPGGNYDSIPGIIRDTRAVSAANIYNQGSFGRGVYVIQATIDEGSSGSPVVLPDGQAAGMIFSKSDSRTDNAYAITSQHLADALKQAKGSHQRVNTGACMR
jgi:hypothetical protein